MSFLNFNKNPVAYGAIMYNGSAGGIASCYPVFTSLSNMSALKSISSTGSSGTITINDIDDYWTVMPGYKLEVYNDTLYSTLILIGDNTSGLSPANYIVNPQYNLASSLKLYFKGTLINEPS